MSHAGFILTGGASSRMGCDKALLDWEGRPMVVHVASIVEQVTASVTLVGSPDKYGYLGFAVIADKESGMGPLAGIRTVLENTVADWNLIVACDMPYLNPQLLARLLHHAEAGSADCCMPPGQPLCAVYHRRCFDEVDKALNAGVRKVWNGLSKLRVELFEVDEPLCFQNINSPQDLPRLV